MTVKSKESIESMESTESLTNIETFAPISKTFVSETTETPTTGSSPSPTQHRLTFFSEADTPIMADDSSVESTTVYI